MLIWIKLLLKFKVILEEDKKEKLRERIKLRKVNIIE